ncbi:MAG: TauD/TfdA family dioxygenase [Acidiferrobacterales bacterium]|nr:TauD/TfdA family dioxygenase [Acidiferrobacterales bacterium]
MARIRRLTGYIGAEVEDIDLRRELGSAESNLIQSALNEYHVIAFRKQLIDSSQQKSLTKLFGDVGRLPYVRPTEEDPDVIAVLKEAQENQAGVFGGEWHSDFSFLENPPAGSVLRAVDIPPVGGDTLWASQVAAFENLPLELKTVIENRNGIHVGKPYGVKFAPPVSTQVNGSIKMVRGDPAADREVSHPAVVTLPKSGKKALFLNPIYTVRLGGMTVEESQPYLQAIYQHATKPDFCMRWHWQSGDVVVWDNRASMHYATNDYNGFRRLLYRTTYVNEAPV